MRSDQNVYASRLEADYASRLKLLRLGGEIQTWRYEAVRLRLAKKTFYNPDFLVVRNDGSLELHEVKGRPREDSRVKWKVAAEMYPFFRWFWVTRRRGQWVFEQYGNGRES
jgi:hypothetical protein